MPGRQNPSPHKEEPNEARGEESLKYDCSTVHMHHQQGREPYCSKGLTTTSEQPVAEHDAVQTQVQPLEETRLKNKNKPNQSVGHQ